MSRTVTHAGTPGAGQEGWVLLVSTPGDVRAFALPERGYVTIGRDPSCEIAIDHEKISRKHARLSFSDAGWAIADLGSRNGTHVRGESLRADHEAPLSPGEPIAIGPFSAVIVPRAVSTVRAAISGAALVVDDPSDAQSSPLVVAVARSAVNVVITGETGTGKEVLARALHRISGRHGPFLGINCAAVAPQLLESELFGHEKGAFTSAGAAKQGLLEAAEGGTVLFDEIGEMSLELQAKLLRAIETREVLRVGAVKPTPIDVRFLAATHRDLLEEGRAGRFRQDLYYRLAGITLKLPALRERPSRIAALASSFARQAGAALAPGAVAKLAAHDWPGNVRELKNVVERGALFASGAEIGAEHVLLDAPRAPASAVPPSPPAAPSGGEREKILAALEACAGNQTQAAKKLGVSRATLVHKLDLLGIPRPRKR